jgi:hypothetical protein
VVSAMRKRVPINNEERPLGPTTWQLASASARRSSRSAFGWMPPPPVAPPTQKPTFLRKNGNRDSLARRAHRRIVRRPSAPAGELAHPRFIS